MSTPAQIPVFDPQGVLRDIPEDQLPAAVKAGGMPAVKFKAPDNSVRFVPANRTQEAAQAGGQIQPYEQQDVKHPGFWASLPGDAWNAVKGAVTAGPEGGDMGEFEAESAYQQKLINEGHSLPYRMLMSLTPASMRERAESGDAGGVGSAAAVQAATAASPLAVEAAAPVVAKVSDAASAAANGELAGKVNASAKVLGHSAEEIPGVGGVIRATKKLGALRDIWGRPLDATSENVPFAGENEPPPSPAAPNPALTSPARTLPGQISPEVIGSHPQPAAPIPARPGLALPPGEAGSMAESVAEPAATEGTSESTPSGEGIPRTLSGESALRQILTGQDTPNLMRIARSRGINVTQEANLKPSIAGPKVINKIVDDFSPEELDDLRDQYLENMRMGKHDFGDIGPEAWKTLGMKSYFPDVKIPAAQQIRTAAAIRNAASAPKPIAAAPVTDVAAQIKEAAAQPRTIVTDPTTGRPEFSDVVAARQNAAQPAAANAAQAAPTKAAPAAQSAPTQDLTSLLKQSVDQVKAQPGGVFTSASPADLAKRWGVDENSIADTDANVRGMNSQQSQAYIDKLAKAYKQGRPVEPVMETRDADNNVISVDGRHRALAAQKAGIDRIPIIVRRIGAAAPTQ
jgi:hypothetical protein